MGLILLIRIFDLGKLHFIITLLITIISPIRSLNSDICGNTNLTKSEGIIESPKYPFSFSSEANCTWKIYSPPNTILKINVLDLDIEDNSLCTKILGEPCCDDNYVSLPHEGGRGYHTFCGRNLTMNSITTAQAETDIKFYQSRKGKRGRGFKISYIIDVLHCTQYDFQCFNTRCVSNSSFCNGIDDCGDLSDERNCIHINTGRKIDEDIILSKHSKEMGLCSEDKVPCTFSPNHCYSPKLEVCDGVFDCPKGEDEVSCDEMCPGQIKCSSGDSCYTPVQRCNSVRNCKDNSDETGCIEETCGPLQYVCMNYACVPASALCDGNNDCGDLSDEENCTKTSLMTAAIMVLLACVFLFAIGLGCLYRLYTIRLRASATFMQHLEPEPIDDDFIYREPPPAYSVAVGDTRIITYPSADMSERFFENDISPRGHRSRCPRRNRRRSRADTSNCTTALPRPRSRPINPTSQTNVTHPNPKQNEFKLQQTVPSSNGQFELSGLNNGGNSNSDIVVSTSRPSTNHNNESPCSSPSLSPSRESVTSSTSLEDQLELVSTCQS